MKTFVIADTKHKRNWINGLRHHPLAGFFTLAFTISWLIWLPAVLGKGGFGWLPLSVTDTLLAILGALAGPMFAAFFMTAICDGAAGVKALLCGMAKWHVDARWYVFVLIGIPIIIILGLMLMGSGPALMEVFHAIANSTDVALNLLTAWLISFIVYLIFGGPLGEEPGWRGFALPRLQKAHGPLTGSLILGILWGAWHLPMFLVPAINPSGRGTPASPEGIFSFWALVMFSTVIYTWVFNNTRGSIFMAILLHAAMNTTSANLRMLFPEVPHYGFALVISFGIVAMLIIALTKGRLSYQSGAAKED